MEGGKGGGPGEGMLIVEEGGGKGGVVMHAICDARDGITRVGTGDASYDIDGRWYGVLCSLALCIAFRLIAFVTSMFVSE